MSYQGTLILKKIGIESDSHDENKCFILNSSSEMTEGDLHQYLKKFKQNATLQPVAKPEKIKPSLKDEIALAGTELKQKQHHGLFFS